jgi:hypothetical protein
LFFFHAKFCLFFKEENSCNYPPLEKKPRWNETTLMQAARPSIIKYAGRITHALDQPMAANLLMPGPSNATVSSTQPGRKLKREWAASHNASAQPTQDREVEPLHALPGSSGVEAQSEFVSIYIFFPYFQK